MKNTLYQPMECPVCGKFYFSELQEGDEISLYCKEYDITIKLVCDQLGYRYNRFGRFEDVYARLTN